ncbi:hypothetical protein KM043_017827 [Ampulex compressa]|nr:hypothetical protein KM043_017827 [Ampulex compressa]
MVLGSLPIPPGDSPALLLSSVIFYWVYDVINLIAVPPTALIVTHLNRWTLGAAHTASTCPVILGIFGSANAADFERDTPGCVNYRLYGPTVHSLLSGPFKRRVRVYGYFEIHLCPCIFDVHFGEKNTVPPDLILTSPDLEDESR